MLLIVKAIEPVRGHFATKLVVIEMDLLQLAVSDPGIAFGDASGELRVKENYWKDKSSV